MLVAHTGWRNCSEWSEWGFTHAFIHSLSVTGVARKGAVAAASAQHDEWRRMRGTIRTTSGCWLLIFSTAFSRALTLHSTGTVCAPLSAQCACSLSRQVSSQGATAPAHACLTQCLSSLTSANETFITTLSEAPFKQRMRPTECVKSLSLSLFFCRLRILIDFISKHWLFGSSFIRSSFFSPAKPPTTIIILFFPLRSVTRQCAPFALRPLSFFSRIIVNCVSPPLPRVVEGCCLSLLFFCGKQYLHLECSCDQQTTWPAQKPYDQVGREYSGLWQLNVNIMAIDLSPMFMISRDYSLQSLEFTY